MKNILFLIFVLPLFCIAQSKQNIDTLKFDKVKFIAAGVTCSMCSNAIHKSLSNDKQIAQISPNLQTQEWIMTYPKGKFDEQKLRKQVADAGFSISKIWLNDKLIYELKKRKKQ